MSVLAILPLILCALVIIVAKRSALVGACSGIVAACALIAGGVFSITGPQITEALTDAAILSVSAILVILPGLYFNAIMKAQGTIRAIGIWVEHLPYSNVHKMLLLLFGLLPAIESLTGFGVSLFLGVPILFHLFSEPRALRLSMLSMNIMPWGTLALATIVGASLSGVPVAVLGWYTALTSCLVFPTLALIALYVIGGLKTVRSHGGAALGLSIGLSAALVVLNSFPLTEVAGVLAGLVVCIGGALLLPKQASMHAIAEKPPILGLFLPYAGVLLLIVLEHMVPGIDTFLSHALVFSSNTVALHVLTSPGIALLLVALVLYGSRPVSLVHKTLLARASMAGLTLLAFITLAQVMLKSRMIATFAKALAQSNDPLLLFFSPVIGMVSGFITGSNLSGNALTMAMQRGIGEHVGAALSFAAAQNSGAGHGIFASIPIIVLILTIAKDVDSRRIGRHATSEYALLKFGLKAASLVLLALIIATWGIHWVIG